MAKEQFRKREERPKGKEDPETQKGLKSQEWPSTSLRSRRMPSSKQQRCQGSFFNITIYHKITAVLTAVLFLFNIIGTDLAWAIKSDTISHLTPEELLKRKELDIDSFQMPSVLGEVKDRHKGRAGTIIYIQDAHCNYAAQRAIADIIDHLNKTYGVDLINLEGGEADYDLSLFTDIKDKDVRKRVSDYFVKEGRVSGPEFFAINNPEKVTLYGIEEANLYIKNLDVYRDSLKYVAEVNNTLDYVASRIKELKKHIYTDKLFELDQKYNNFKDEAIDLKEFIQYLFNLTLRKKISLKKFPNTRSLYEAISKEETIDFKRANSQRDKLIDELKERLSDNAMDELTLKSFLFKTGQLSQGAYYNYLKEVADKYRVDLSNKKDLSNYILYINLYEEADKVEVFNEIEDLFELLAEKEFENETQKRLFKISKHTQILKNIFNIKATKREINYFNKHKDEFDITTILDFIQKEFLKIGESPHFDNSARLIDIHRDEILKFYKYALARDEVFIKNVKRSHNRFAKDTSIIVAGGFHTENLTEILKQNGLSYIVIRPTFKNGDGYKSPYYKLLSGGLSDLETKIVEAISAIALVSIFTDLAARVYSAEEYDSIVNKLQEIKQQLMVVGKFLVKTEDNGTIELTLRGDDIIAKNVGGTTGFNIELNQRQTAALREKLVLPARDEEAIVVAKGPTPPAEGPAGGVVRAVGLPALFIIGGILAERYGMPAEVIRWIFLGALGLWTAWMIRTGFGRGEKKDRDMAPKEPSPPAPTTQRPHAVEQPATAKSLTLQSVNLKEEIDKSGLSEAQIKLLQAHSKGILTIYEFLQTLPGSTKQGGYSLGLTNYMDIYKVLSEVSGLITWTGAYDELFGDRTERTDEFLDIITSKGKPIVFFVPRDIFEHRAAEVTKREIEWFLSHPDRMAKVYFVFGAYETITKDDFVNSGFSMMSQTERQNVMADIFRNFRDYMKEERTYKPAEGIDVPLRDVRLAFVPPISRSGLREFNRALKNIDELHLIMEQPIYHPVAISIYDLPLELQNILNNIPIINLHGSQITAYDFLRSCVDEIIFTPYIQVETVEGNKFYPAEGYIDRRFRPGKRVIFINVLHPANILAAVNREHIKISPANRRDVHDLFRQIIHEAAHKYVQRLVQEGVLEPIYETDINWFEKIATSIERGALINLCSVLRERFGEIPTVIHLIGILNKIREEEVEKRIEVCNKNLGLRDEDYNLPAAQPPAEGSDKEGMCVTADTMLLLKGGQEVPIVEVKPGDYVLSLNEDSQNIEPRRVKGLLDMGIKPVYRLTTASGRSIKTTANHPYLTQDGWIKVKDLKVGGEIAVLNDTLKDSILSKSNHLAAHVKSYYEAIKDIFLSKQIEIGPQMCRETYASTEGNMPNLYREGMQIYRDKTTITYHGIGNLPFSVVDSQIRGDGRKENGDTSTSINIGFGLEGSHRPRQLYLYDRIKFFFVNLVRKPNYLFSHKICKRWTNSSGPGTGNDRGIAFGNVSLAFLTAFLPVNIFPWHITIRWCGYFLTNFSRFFFINKSLSNAFGLIFSPLLGRFISTYFIYKDTIFLNKSQASGKSIKVRELEVEEGIAVPRLDFVNSVAAFLNHGKTTQQILDFFIRGRCLNVSNIFNFMPTRFKNGSNASGTVGIDKESHRCLLNRLADKFLLIGQKGRIQNAGSDILEINRGEFLLNGFKGHSTSQCLKNYIDRSAGPFDARSPMLDVRVNNDMLFQQIFVNHLFYLPVLFYHTFSIYHALLKMSRFFAPKTAYAQPALDGHILWDRITSIEYIGYEHVYDIEETQEIEPRRVKGLLDMGIKPVYRLTTASGRSIKTTANHPYLTQNGWVKVSELKAGKEIAVPLVPLSSGDKSDSSSGVRKGDIEAGKEVLASQKVESYTQTRRKTDCGTEGYGAKFNGERKEINRYRTPIPYGAINYFSLFDIYAKILGLIGCKDGYRSAGVHVCLESNPSFRSSYFEADYRGSYTFVYSIGEFYRRSLHDKICVNSSGLGTGMLVGIMCGYFFLAFSNASSPVKTLPPETIICRPPYFSTSHSKWSVIQASLLNSFFFLFLRAILLTSALKYTVNIGGSQGIIGVAYAQEELDGHILWDRIASIEYIGYEHVYDIEVEGTHNFIGNAIFAHNTYIHPTTPPAEGPGKGPGKGVLGFIADSIFALMRMLGIEITQARKNFVEDFIVPPIEEGLMFLGLCFGSLPIYTFIRGAFVLLHIRDRAPPWGIKHTLLERLLIPTTISIIAITALAIFGATPLGLTLAILAHMTGNLYVTITKSRLQKAVVGDAGLGERLLSHKFSKKDSEEIIQLIVEGGKDEDEVANSVEQLLLALDKEAVEYNYKVRIIKLLLSNPETVEKANELSDRNRPERLKSFLTLMRTFEFPGMERLPVDNILLSVLSSPNFSQREEGLANKPEIIFSFNKLNGNLKRAGIDDFYSAAIISSLCAAPNLKEITDELITEGDTYQFLIELIKILEPEKYERGMDTTFINDTIYLILQTPDHSKIKETINSFISVAQICRLAQLGTSAIRGLLLVLLKTSNPVETAGSFREAIDSFISVGILGYNAEFILTHLLQAQEPKATAEVFSALIQRLKNIGIADKYDMRDIIRSIVNSPAPEKMAKLFLIDNSVIIETIINNLAHLLGLGILDSEEKLNIALNIVESGFVPTANLIECALKSGGTPIANFNKIKNEIENGGFKLDKIEEPLRSIYIDIEYTHFVRIWVGNGFDIQRADYISYIKFINGSHRPGEAILDEIGHAEIDYAVYEAMKLLDFVKELKSRAESLNKEVVVVANMSYGGFVIDIIEEELASLGIKVIRTKIGSTQCHENPWAFKEDLFTDEDLKYIIENHPIRIVVDGTQHLVARVGEGEGKESRYPDAWWGYGNYDLAIKIALEERGILGSEVVDDYLEATGKNRDFLHGFPRAFFELKDKIKNMIRDLKNRLSHYGFLFWNPGDETCILREKRKMIREIRNVKIDSINGPCTIFVNAVLLDEKIPPELKGLHEGIKHMPAYFDDTKIIKEISLSITDRGVVFEKKLEDIVKERYAFVERFLAASSIAEAHDTKSPAVPPATELVATEPKFIPIKAVIADFDDTLVKYPHTIEGQALVNLIEILRLMPVAIITEEREEKLEERLWRHVPKELRKNLHIFSNGGTRGFGFDESGEKISYPPHDIDDSERERILKIVAEVLSREGIDYSEVKAIRYKVKLAVGRIQRDNIAQLLKKAFLTKGVEVSISFQGGHYINIYVWSKVNAARYFEQEILQKLAISMNDTIVFANSINEFGGDRVLFDGLDEALLRINVGKVKSPPPTNVSIYHLDRQGPTATNRILADIARNNGNLDLNQLAYTPTPPAASAEPLDLVSTVSPIGKRFFENYSIIDVIINEEENTLTLIVEDREGEQQELSLGAILSRAPPVSKSIGDVAVTHRDLIEMIIGSLPESVRFRTFTQLHQDLFGFASPEHNIIALHESLTPDSESPDPVKSVALFHEIGEYLVKDGLLELKLEGGSLIIYVRDSRDKPFTRIGEVELSEEPLAIAQKGPENQHYLLRAFQRQVFGDSDRRLTERIKRKQVVTRGINLLVGRIIAELQGKGIQFEERTVRQTLSAFFHKKAEEDDRLRIEGQVHNNRGMEGYVEYRQYRETLKSRPQNGNLSDKGLDGIIKAQHKKEAAEEYLERRRRLKAEYDLTDEDLDSLINLHNDFMNAIGERKKRLRELDTPISPALAAELVDIGEDRLTQILKEVGVEKIIKVKNEKGEEEEITIGYLVAFIGVPKDAVLLAEEGKTVYLSHADRMLREGDTRNADWFVEEIKDFAKEKADGPLRILSIGPGNAVLEAYIRDQLQERGIKVEFVLLDFVDMFLDEVKRRGFDTLVTGDTHLLSNIFQPSTFDIVIMSEVLGGMAEYVIADEIIRVLKPGGRALVTVLGREMLVEGKPHKRDETRMPGWERPDADWTVDALEKAGLKVVKHEDPLLKGIRVDEEATDSLNAIVATKPAAEDLAKGVPALAEGPVDTETAEAFRKLQGIVEREPTDLESMATEFEKLVTAIDTLIPDSMVKQHLARLNGGDLGAWNEINAYGGLLRKAALLHEKYELMKMKFDHEIDLAKDIGPTLRLVYERAHREASKFEAIYLALEAHRLGMTDVNAKALYFARPKDISEFIWVPMDIRRDLAGIKDRLFRDPDYDPDYEEIEAAVTFLVNYELIPPENDPAIYRKKLWNKLIFRRLHREFENELGNKLGGYYPALILRVLDVFDKEGYDAYQNLYIRDFEETARVAIGNINEFVKRQERVWGALPEHEDGGYDFFIRTDYSDYYFGIRRYAGDFVGLKKMLMDLLAMVSQGHARGAGSEDQGAEAQRTLPAGQEGVPPGMGGIDFVPDEFEAAYNELIRGKITAAEFLMRIKGPEGLLTALEISERDYSLKEKLTEVLKHLSEDENVIKLLKDIASSWARNRKGMLTMAERLENALTQLQTAIESVKLSAMPATAKPTIEPAVKGVSLEPGEGCIPVDEYLQGVYGTITRPAVLDVVNGEVAQDRGLLGEIGNGLKAESKYIAIINTRNLAPFVRNSLSLDMLDNNLFNPAIESTKRFFSSLGYKSLVVLQADSAEGLKKKLDKCDATPDNTFIYCENKTADASVDDVRRVFPGYMHANLSTPEGRTGFVCVGGLVALGIAAMDLRQKAKIETRDLEHIYELLAALQLKSVEAVKEEVPNPLQAFNRGELNIELPPIRPAEVEKKLELLYRTEPELQRAL